MIEPFNYIKTSANVELVYKDKNNEQYSFCTHVLSVLPDKIKMKKPINKLEEFTIIDNYEKLELNFYTEDGVFTCNLNFLDFVDNTYTDIFTSYPYNCNFFQRRDKKRMPFHVDCELNILNSGNGVLDTSYFKTKDISETGIACITKEPLSEFENARLILHFENLDIIAFCEKIYSKEIELNNEQIYLNGLKFTEISKNDVKIITHEILKFQFETQEDENAFETI